jgi:opacity protein-like surface antigen
LGVGGSRPHPESDVLGIHLEHYQAGGYSLQVAAGLEYRIWRNVRWLGEYKFTRAHERVDVSGGTAEGSFISHHLVTGVGYCF